MTAEPPGQAPADPLAVLDAFIASVTAGGRTLYAAQEEAMLELASGNHVILATPTGSGKSLVAEALVALARSRRDRVALTFPIKALVHEKFFALVERFGADKVGLSTGDASVNDDAPILCCTAEVLAQQALAMGAETPFEAVVMDEFHYYGDRDRGMAWQLPLLAMPRAQFLLMSATLPDTRFFEEDLTRRTGRRAVTVRSEERPVPLAFRWSEAPLPDLLSGLAEEGWLPAYVVHFSQRAAAETAQALRSQTWSTREERDRVAARLEGQEFPSPFGKELRGLLRHGIAVHHAGLLPRYRLLVEQLAQEGLLKVICGTDTLGVGINVPIRSVVFTALSKFDGRKVAQLAVRDFRQIAGRAGRRGFDSEGLVVAQAPEHVIENRRLEAWAGADPARKRKLVRKQPPTGFVGWGSETFAKLQVAPPEVLGSRFRMTPSVVLAVLGREEEDGCRALRALVEESHETPAAKKALRRRAFQLVRALMGRGLLVPVPAAERVVGGPKLRPGPTVPRDFTLARTLSLYFHDLVGTFDATDPDHALRVVSIAEAIVEDPGPILQRQLEAVKTEKIQQWKEEGIPYEERMERLLTLTWPKPEEDLITATFAIFAEGHPWVDDEAPSPKSVVREMLERGWGFADAVKAHGIQRQEGLLLRHLGQVWRVLDRTLPESARTEELEEILAWLEGEVRGTDTSLLAEWERLAGLAGEPVPERASASAPPPRRREPWRADQPAFRRLARAAAHALVRALARGNPEEAEVLAPRGEDGSVWDARRWEEAAEAYRKRKGAPPRLDPEARSAARTRFETAPDGRSLDLEQVLVDAEGADDTVILLTVDPAAAEKLGRVVFTVRGITQSIS